MHSSNVSVFSHPAGPLPCAFSLFFSVILSPFLSFRQCKSGPSRRLLLARCIRRHFIHKFTSGIRLLPTTSSGGTRARMAALHLGIKRGDLHQVPQTTLTQPALVSPRPSPRKYTGGRGHLCVDNQVQRVTSRGKRAIPRAYNQ